MDYGVWIRCQELNIRYKILDVFPENIPPVIPRLDRGDLLASFCNRFEQDNKMRSGSHLLKYFRALYSRVTDRSTYITDVK